VWQQDDRIFCIIIIIIIIHQSSVISHHPAPVATSGGNDQGQQYSAARVFSRRAAEFAIYRVIYSSLFTIQVLLAVEKRGIVRFCYT